MPNIATTYAHLEARCAGCGKLLGNCVYYGIIKCPRCGENNLSDFRPVRTKDETKDN